MRWGRREEAVWAARGRPEQGHVSHARSPIVRAGQMEEKQERACDEGPVGSWSQAAQANRKGFA
ncbi:hypothetical protein BCEP27_20106 [Burkholderia cepacia]